MEHSNHFKIGFVQKPHGLKGEVTIALEPTTPVEPETLTSVFIEIKGRLVPYFIESLSMKGDKAFVKFEDVHSSEAAGTLKNAGVYLPLEVRPKSGKGEFYPYEVIGFTVTDTAIGELGTIGRVESETINPLLIVLTGTKEIAIPINAPFIKRVVKSAKKIEVELPEGLIDL
jgi:16S rRNA processing protein RimM